MIKVFTNGCFDLFHAGHLKILEEAKKLGDVLYVGINSDSSVKSLKGDTRPIIPQEQRLQIVSSIKYVDEAFIFDELTPLNLIKRLKPNIIVKGGDWNIYDIVGHDVAEPVTVELLNGISTTKIIFDVLRKYKK